MSAVETTTVIVTPKDFATALRAARVLFNSVRCRTLGEWTAPLGHGKSEPVFGSCDIVRPTRDRGVVASVDGVETRLVPESASARVLIELREGGAS